ncbi:diaminobutyrate acetyltransferase [Myceligenerans crystallogenes]|uniref:diaminobutyrate acetyltransferase n=1 Tax=Myceligenerans crystallogenes TaxID=316335 RepID=UPI0031D5AA6E
MNRPDTPGPHHAELREPAVADGPAMWRIARDSRDLDLNSHYAYMLWARDFAATSVIAAVDGNPAGFLTAYVRPDEPTTLMVWQVAVDAAYRGRRLAARMLEHAVGAAPRCTHLETTITADNAASIALFTSFARARGARVDRTPLFTEETLGGDHATEHLFRIGPVAPAT